MPRILTEAYIRNLKPAAAGQRYTLADAMVPGLKLRVTEKGTKTFLLWRRLHPSNGSASALALGKVGELSLADARAKARRWIDLIKAGIDPREERRVDTFSVVMADYLERHVRNQRKAADVERVMRRELETRWGTRPITQITRRDVIAVIDTIRDRGAPYQARNCLGHAKVFFNWCVERSILTTSPCDHIRPQRIIGPTPPRQRILSDDEVRAFWKATGQLGYPMGPLFRLLLLTGQRRSEVAESTWPEFDLPNAVWTIPKERFKSDAPHLVPLSDDAQALLEDLPRWNGGHYLFSYAGGRSPPTQNDGKPKAKLDKVMKAELGGTLTPFVIHDLRRVVRSHLAALRVPDHIAEMVIGHGRKGIARVYDQHNYLSEMRQALQEWADRLRRIVAE